MKIESEKDLMMYYQTTIRNVALMTAVSFAALGYSRFYRGASKLYSVGLSLVSFLIISCSATINFFLYKTFSESEYSENMKGWLIINKTFFVVHTMVIVLGLFTSYRAFISVEMKREKCFVCIMKLGIGYFSKKVAS